MMLCLYDLKHNSALKAYLADLWNEEDGRIRTGYRRIRRLKLQGTLADKDAGRQKIQGN